MGYDRISHLPDALITQILLWLPTIDSVKTSVLSTRWRNLCLHVPGIDFHSDDLDCFSKGPTNSFGQRFLERNREPRLQKFKIKFSEWFANLSHISDYCYGPAVDNYEAQHPTLGVQNAMCFIAFMPVNVFQSKTLVSLTLQRVVAPRNPDFVVSLPCLKIMHLEIITDFYNLSFTEKLISCCPVLEDLNVVRKYHDFLKTMRVRSQSLKILRLEFHPRIGSFEHEVEIDAPGLKYLSYKDNHSGRIVVKNLNSLLMIDIDTKFNVNLGGLLVSNVVNKRDLIREFLTGISKVKHMIISQPTLEVLRHYSKLGRIPQFHNLSHLQAAFSSSSLPLLPVFLESCSNLKTLIVDFCLPREPKQKINLTIVPQCLKSTLERVEINKLYQKEGTGMKLASYFLMNSVVLKKLNLNHSYMNNQDIDFYKSLFTLIKLSPKCQVFFDDMQLIMLGRK